MKTYIYVNDLDTASIDISNDIKIDAIRKISNDFSITDFKRSLPNITVSFLGDGQIDNEISYNSYFDMIYKENIIFIEIYDSSQRLFLGYFEKDKLEQNKKEGVIVTECTASHIFTQLNNKIINFRKSNVTEIKNIVNYLLSESYPSTYQTGSIEYLDRDFDDKYVNCKFDLEDISKDTIDDADYIALENEILIFDSTEFYIDGVENKVKIYYTGVLIGDSVNESSIENVRILKQKSYDDIITEAVTKINFQKLKQYNNISLEKKNYDVTSSTYILDTLAEHDTSNEYLYYAESEKQYYWWTTSSTTGTLYKLKDYNTLDFLETETEIDFANFGGEEEDWRYDKDITVYLDDTKIASPDDLAYEHTWSDHKYEIQIIPEMLRTSNINALPIAVNNHYAREDIRDTYEELNRSTLLVADINRANNDRIGKFEYNPSLFNPENYKIFVWRKYETDVEGDAIYSNLYESTWSGDDMLDGKWLIFQNNINRVTRNIQDFYIVNDYNETDNSPFPNLLENEGLCITINSSNEANLIKASSGEFYDVTANTHTYRTTDYIETNGNIQSTVTLELYQDNDLAQFIQRTGATQITDVYGNTRYRVYFLSFNNVSNPNDIVRHSLDIYYSSGWKMEQTDEAQYVINTQKILYAAGNRNFYNNYVSYTGDNWIQKNYSTGALLNLEAENEKLLDFLFDFSKLLLGTLYLTDDNKVMIIDFPNIIAEINESNPIILDSVAIDEQNFRKFNLNNVDIDVNIDNLILNAYFEERKLEYFGAFYDIYTLQTKQTVFEREDETTDTVEILDSVSYDGRLGIIISKNYNFDNGIVTTEYKILLQREVSFVNQFGVI